jgi:predicted DCC family thiol-disulfide oxidoreductase YuxK
LVAGVTGAARGGAARVAEAYRNAYSAVTDRRFSGRGVAALRIGYGSVWAAFLLDEFGERETAWGPDAVWSPAIDRQYAALEHWNPPIRLWFTALSSLTRTEFDLCYLAAIAVGVALALGWHSRALSVLFALVVAAFENRAPMITDGGDNLLILMSVYLVFTASGDLWSLDARRRARRAAGRPGLSGRVAGGRNPFRRVTGAPWWSELRHARGRMVTVEHNGAVLLVAAQICLVYGTAGFTKVQGSMWQDGSALGYVLRLDWFRPWPGLSSALAAHPVPMAVAGYVTVFVQAGFPFIVFSRRLKYPALVVLIGMHLSIMVLLGLPFFSTIMIIGDAVFLSDRVWAAIGGAVAGPGYAGIMDGYPGTAQEPTLVFDGDCAFCTSAVRLARRWCRPAVRFVPWQEIDLGAHGLTEDQVQTSVRYLPLRSAAPIRSGAAAVARTLLRSRWPWRPLGAVLLIPPFSWLGEAAYKLIAANRYRLPGGTPACAVSAHARPAPGADASGPEAPQDVQQSADQR